MTNETTSEEKVREYYEKVKELSKTPSYAIHGYLGEKRAIVQTLNLLGISIEGVNAE